QGVVVEGFASSGDLMASDNTDADGKYALNDLPAGKYTLKATWSANDITSSVSKSGVDCGASGVNFQLSVSYQLAVVSGVIPSAYRTAERYRMSALAAQNARQYVELFQRGRRIAVAYADDKGRFTLANLLPGTYGIRLFNGREFTEMDSVRLSEGERLEYSPKWALLNKEAVYAYPNPARNEVSLHFETNFEDFVAEIAVFDVGGRLVKKFSNSELQRNYDAPGSGKHRGYWPLKGDNVASGVYIWVLNIKNPLTEERERVIKKFAIIR
ncbi:MAG TPA: T9SS type A sorting domain-containing protein, partial [Elusimicrobiales bacterium]|nr:T9SS type A sorting domain-containing protein [Elusimicrobiales bacterium]